MGKISKAKTAVRVSIKERTGYTVRGLSIKQANGMKGISRRFPKQRTGYAKMA